LFIRFRIASNKLQSSPAGNGVAIDGVFVMIGDARNEDGPNPLTPLADERP
jgi:hypothetical protein